MRTGANREPDLAWRLLRRIMRFVIARAAHRVLSERTLHMSDGRRLRWLGSETSGFVASLDEVATGLRKHARHLPDLSFGNRLMVELSIYTVASYQRLLCSGLQMDCAKEVTADVGWHVYRRLLMIYSLPVRILTRDPATRLSWTIKLLLRFPFSTHGHHGYRLKSWNDQENVYTHFTRCPPQSFARSASEAENDEEILDAFYRSWCLYDWPGADVIAGDGKRGHYRRNHTLSRGDAVCDMCWAARVADQDRAEESQ